MGLKPGQTTSTSFSKANPRPGPGRRKMTEEEKRQARIRRAVEYDFKMECRALLPLATDQLEKRLVAGRMKDTDALRALEILRDTVHGKPPQTLQAPGGGALTTSFSVILQQIDGTRTEKLGG